MSLKSFSNCNQSILFKLKKYALNAKTSLKRKCLKEGEGGSFEGIPNKYVENKDRHEGQGYRDKRRIVQLVEMRMLNNGDETESTEQLHKQMERQ